MSYARNIGGLADASGLIATAKLADSAVTTIKVAANAVTYAKMQSVTAGKVLGRDTSGAGVVQELPIAVNTDGSVGLGGNSGGGKLEVYAAQTAAAGNKIKIQGYQVGFEVLNAAQTQNWYMGVADADSSKLYIGRGYGVGQGIAPAMKVDASDNFGFNSGYGSAATAYGCRAWVNFNGTGTVAIRGSGNVTSITDNGTGDYTVNFTSAMPDANYSANITSGLAGVSWGIVLFCGLSGRGTTNPLSTTQVRFQTVNPTDAPLDNYFLNVSIFR